MIRGKEGSQDVHLVVGLRRALKKGLLDARGESEGCVMLTVRTSVDLSCGAWDHSNTALCLQMSVRVGKSKFEAHICTLYADLLQLRRPFQMDASVET